MIIVEEKLRKIFNEYDNTQYQPCGIDLKLEKVELMSYNHFDEIGIIEQEKILPNYCTVDPYYNNYYKLHKGYCYILDLGYIEIPTDTACFFWLRSTFARMGVFMSDAVGDAGFKGHIKVCIIPIFCDVNIKKGERVVQAVFIESKNSGTYNGTYQEVDGGE